jgi:alpha-N-arabinofuranosidase
MAGLHDNPCGDLRFYNNLFVLNGDLSPFDGATLPMHLAGNVFLDGAKPCKAELDPTLVTDFRSDLNFASTAEECYLTMRLDSGWAARATKTITSELLGKAIIPDLAFERPGGGSYRLDRDYAGHEHGAGKPLPGPFLARDSGGRLKLWPRG